MYDLSERFKPIKTNTPSKVGPATYTLPDYIDGNSIQQHAPFLSRSERLFCLNSPDAQFLPSAADYFPHYRKYRIQGGTSLRNRARRFVKRRKFKRPGPTTYNLHRKYERKQGVGKLYLCVPPRLRKTTPTIPEKGFICYDIKRDGEIVKIVDPAGDTTLGPCFYNVPQGETCFNTKKYKGNHWSFMSEIRFKSKFEDTPEPGKYDLSNKPLPPQKVIQEKICERLRKASKQERYLDKIVNQIKRENLPGPGLYDITTSIKTDKKKVGTFSKAARGCIYQITDGPGPATYTDPRTAMSKATKCTSCKGSPFMSDAPRSPPDIKPTPGPSDYVPNKGLFRELQKKYHPDIMKNTPFSTTAVRNMAVINPDSHLTPGPADYNLQKKLVKKSRRNNMFGSREPRFIEKIDMVQASCASYSIDKAFSTIKDPKSHLKSKRAAFLSTSERSGLLHNSCAPAPTTYDPPDSSLKIRGCVFPRDVERGTIKITPGPADYSIHPKMIKSSVFSTHNITLQPDIRMSSSLWYRMITAPKKLKCFT